MVKEKTEKSSLLDRIKENSTIKETAVITQSKILKDMEVVSTSIPMLNVALSGDINGGFISGLTQFAGPSKHFKTLFALILAKAYLDKYPDAILLLYISEFGQPMSYFDSLHIDKSRVILSPIVDVEQLKSEMMNQLENLERGDRVFVLVDSIGNLASRKETEDALNEKSVSDMTRAKALKSLFRMVGIRLTLKDIPMVIINHSYQTLELYSKQVASGGTGTIYNSDNIFMIGRQAEKEADEHSGYNFTLTVEKSRFVKEKSKINISVSFERGVNKWSGLLEDALEFGFVTKVGPNKFLKAGGDISFKERETSNEEFWKPILIDPGFQQKIREKYQLENDLLEV